MCEAGVDNNLIINDQQQWRDQVTHALHVANVQVVPHICGHNVPQDVQVLLVTVVVHAPVTAGHILVYTVEVQTESLHKFLK